MNAALPLPRRSHVRRLGVPLIAALALLVGPISPAQAAETLNGTVVAAAGGGPVSNVSVSLEKRFGEGGGTYWDSPAQTLTSGSGTYSFGAADAGTYRIAVRDNSSVGYVRKTSPEFTVDGSGTTTVPAIQLVVGGRIIGTVTKAAGGSSDNIAVTAHRIEANVPTTIYEAGTNNAGAYTLKGLPTGTYRLEFHPLDTVHVDEFWENSDTLEQATNIPVTEGSTTGPRDAVLAIGGTISGKVTADGAGGASLAGIVVSASRQVTTGGVTRWVTEGFATSGSDGSYTVPGLPTGTYALFFADNGDAQGRPSYDREYYQDASTPELAEPVPVTIGAAVLGKNASLGQRGSVVGVITAPDGTPIASGHAYLYRYVDDGPSNGAFWSEVADAVTDATGHYDIKNVEAGTYHLAFVDDAGVHVSEFYENAATHDAATGVTVTSATTVARNASLALPPVATTPPVVVPPIVNPPIVNPPAVVKVSPSVKVSVKAGKRKATLTITVRASNGTPTGKVSVKVGKKTYRVTLKNGKGKLTIKKLKKGKISFKVVYSGDAKVLGKTVKSKKVTIT